MRRALLLTAILAGLALGYLYPPLDASRLYVYPYWATNPRADVAHYPLGGCFALFGEDSLNSIRMYRSPADSMPYFRLVTKAGDTVRFNRGGIYTNRNLWAQTVHYTTLDPPVAGGSPDTFKLGLGMVGRGTWAKSGESLAVDTAAMPHGGGGVPDTLLRGYGLQAWGTWTHAGESLAVDSGAVRSFGNTIWLGLLGKAADASGADSADVGVVSRSCTGNAATADSSTGGATRATLAANSSLLQGKDTTALWNAKTLQGKDTTALYAAKTAIKIASDGDSAKVWTMTSPSTQGWLAAGGSSTPASFQLFTADGTWTKPTGAKLVYVECISAGSGGGGGCSDAVGTKRTGGCGAGGGARVSRMFPADALGATETVEVGVGGSGGAGGVAGPGANGAAGTTTKFGAVRLTGLWAFPGGPGYGATVATSKAGGGGAGSASAGSITGTGGQPGPSTYYAFSNLGAASASNDDGGPAEYGGGGGAGEGNNPVSRWGGASLFGPAGGGSGGGVQTDEAQVVGGNGGYHGGYGYHTAGGATGGTSGGGNGTSGANGNGYTTCGGGGGGGGGNSGGNGGNGGNGGAPGGGGGGGGGGTTAGGDGGNGGRGEVRVWVWF